MNTYKSPCTNQCLLDVGTFSCVSCLRTATEIQNWIQYTDEERLSILRDLKRRRKNARVTK